MQEFTQFYIGGEWVDPVAPKTMDVIDPSTEEACARISLGSEADVDRAVKAARQAFARFELTKPKTRGDLLLSLAEQLRRRQSDLADVISLEMGAPISLARKPQTEPCIDILVSMADTLARYRFEEIIEGSLILKEPIGVVGVITPWNWPLQQIVRKVGAAIAAGCTSVLKPSEISPLSGLLFAELVHDAGLPAGVVNVLNGDGPTVGAAIASHPDIDMVSFTGSTRAGVLVAKAAADTVKRIHQELGGKSANIVFDDVDLEEVVSRDVMLLMRNSGQTCNAPTRLLVHRSQHAAAGAIAAKTARSIVVGPPRDEATEMGPLSNINQFIKVQRMISDGIAEGAELIEGGIGRPDGLSKGYYARPTIFANVSPEMTIGREEVFGPVLVIIPYDDEEDAIRIANDSVYGLAAYVSTNDATRARRVASRLKAGNIHINGGRAGPATPFGGYKQSGNGREKGIFGIEEFLEIKALVGS